jgi:stalled ribosome alternative rescue factor ArfA
VTKSIGTKHETSLHRDLKFRYAGQGGITEAEVGGFVADGISAEGEFIEVQTGSFGPLKKKVKELALRGKVRIVYPVIINKYIEVSEKNGKRKYRRKSPRKGNPWDIFDALVYAPDLPLIPNLSIELALVDAEEQRVSDGKGSWRRKGVSIKDRTLLAIHERIYLEKPSDYLRFVPFGKKEPFTATELGHKAGISIDSARKTLYVLKKLGMVEKTGKRGNTLVYGLHLLRKFATKK